MAYREVTMLEVKEVLRLWLTGVRKKRIATQLGLNVKTVRRYLRAAQEHGLITAGSPDQLDDGLLAAVVSTVQPGTGRPHGDRWAACAAQRGVIERYLRADVRLSKIRKLLRRQGVMISSPTLRRFAMGELGWGRAAPTIPLADCGPGEEDPPALGVPGRGPLPPVIPAPARGLTSRRAGRYSAGGGDS
ncbi:MAG: hypothetical protein A2X53_22660 [Candidatus Rokubacteria bacterium GWA2_70_23]|nr:MAG: hypothetical protein A2X53_22660 [Candidatus Rokubacteria bacterium GWA2_70_23]